jgi:hypothetical protein
VGWQVYALTGSAFALGMVGLVQTALLVFGAAAAFESPAGRLCCPAWRRAGGRAGWGGNRRRGAVMDEAVSNAAGCGTAGVRCEQLRGKIVEETLGASAGVREMPNARWFSSRLRFGVIVETIGLLGSLYLFQSSDFEAAFQEALEIGYRNERSYRNGEGQRVVQKLAEVVSLDMIRSESLEAAEIYSEPIPGSDATLGIDHTFHPERSLPNQTV